MMIYRAEPLLLLSLLPLLLLLYLPRKFVAPSVFPSIHPSVVQVYNGDGINTVANTVADPLGRSYSETGRGGESIREVAK